MLERYVNYCCELLSKLPLECMQYNFMQMALLATTAEPHSKIKFCVVTD